MQIFNINRFILAIKTIICIGICFFALPCLSRWSNDPTQALEVGGVDIFSDSLGGVFIPNTTGPLVWPRPSCLWVNRLGDIPWGHYIDICPAASAGAFNPYSYSNSSICSERGKIITWFIAAWITGEDTTYDLRLQKIDTCGNLLWGPAGIQMIQRAWNDIDSVYLGPGALITDGSGGVIIPYMDRNMFYPERYYAQRVSSDGELLWGAEGVPVVDTLGQYQISITQGSTVSDGTGGMIIGSSICIQRLNSHGERLWGENGINCRGYYSRLIPDGEGGAIGYSTSSDGSTYYSMLYRFDSNGHQVWGNGNGLVVLSANYLDALDGLKLGVIKINDIEYLITWGGVSRNVQPYTRIKKFNLNEEVFWNDTNRTISVGDSLQFDLRGVATGDNSAIYVWFDRRDTNGVESSIFAQKINANGERLWSDCDILMLNDNARLYYIVSDCNGGSIVSLYCSNGYCIQQINANGELGRPLFIPKASNPQNYQYEILIYPIPANNFARVSILNPFYRIESVKILNLNGQFVQDVISYQLCQSFSLNLAEIPTGTYIIQIKSNSTILSKTLWVIK